MLRNELIKKLGERLPFFSQKDVERSVRTITNAISDTLADGNRVEIRGFGSFYLKQYGTRKAINPKTGTPVQLSARRMPHFRVSQKIQKNINPEDSVNSASDPNNRS